MSRVAIAVCRGGLLALLSFIACAAVAEEGPDFFAGACVPAAEEDLVAFGVEEVLVCPDGSAKINARHDPIYSASSGISTISATVGLGAESLESFEIRIIRGKVSDCTELNMEAQLFPCRKDAVVLPPVDCLPAFANTGSCSVELELESAELLSYVAVAKPIASTAIATPIIAYSTGVPEFAVAMPAWWHAGKTAGPFESRVNIAFFPDTGQFYEDLAYFSDRLSSILLQSFFREKDSGFGVTYTRNRGLFDLWVVPFDDADAVDDCEHKVAGTFSGIDKVLHGVVVLHDSFPWDCASVEVGNGLGSVNVTEDKPAWVFVHESGHFLFGLGDEYNGGKVKGNSDPANVFADLESCELAKTGYGSNSECWLFGGVENNAYRLVTTEPEIMDERVLTSEFRNTSASAVHRILKTCIAGNCYE